MTEEQPNFIELRDASSGEARLIQRAQIVRVERDKYNRCTYVTLVGGHVLSVSDSYEAIAGELR